MIIYYIITYIIIYYILYNIHSDTRTEIPFFIHLSMPIKSPLTFMCIKTGNALTASVILVELYSENYYEAAFVV